MMFLLLLSKMHMYGIIVKLDIHHETQQRTLINCINTFNELLTNWSQKDLMKGDFTSF